MELIKKGKKADQLIEKIKLSNAQRSALVIIAVTSVVIGFGLVLAIRFLKYIDFNKSAIIEMEKSIANYSRSIKNSGACKAPKDKNGIYTTEELKNCNPSEIGIEDVEGTLRYNVLSKMSQNVNLESVSKDASSICYNNSGEKYSFTELYESYKTETDKDKKNDWLETIILCSSIRAIPDALPTVANENALLIAISKLYLDSGYNPNSFSPSSEGVLESEDSNLKIMPVTFSLDDPDGSKMSVRVLKNIEKSIRTFDVNEASIKWEDNKSKITLSAAMSAYFTDPAEALQSDKTVTAKTTKKGK